MASQQQSHWSQAARSGNNVSHWHGGAAGASAHGAAVAVMVADVLNRALLPAVQHVLGPAAYVVPSSQRQPARGAPSTEADVSGGGWVVGGGHRDVHGALASRGAHTLVSVLGVVKPTVRTSMGYVRALLNSVRFQDDVSDGAILTKEAVRSHPRSHTLGSALTSPGWCCAD